jgi:4-amino-4-deoxy-L-arabinose transferase-like glycosyltransferase
VPAQSNLLRWVWYLLATLFAVFTYFYGLDSQHIPKNGDEYPYAHIARLTAESGHLLPLQSQLDNMRNTKPPLLFWQGMAATDGGQDWTLWNLRYPSVIYTLLTAGLVFGLARRLTQKTETGFIALLTYLAFFSTYRYGRPFLANPAEVFWLFLPFFILLYWRNFGSRLWVPLLLGVTTGIGLLYKSFALIVPVALCLSWWYSHHRQYRWRDCLRQDAPKVALTVALALGIFALWFVFDPDPQAVWNEFVVGENVGKFDPYGDSYFAKLLWGGSSIWALALGYPFNAGLLAIPVAAVGFMAWRRRLQLSDAEKLLWMWLIVLFVVFSLPSQRSARYLLEGMPALAVLCALNWQRIARPAFIASLLMAAGALAFIAFISAHVQQEMTGQIPYGPAYWGLLMETGALVLVGVFMPQYTALVVNVVALLVLCCFASLLQPFDSGLGSYNAVALQTARGRDVWVPCDFRAKEEGYRFILPGAKVHGYHEDLGLSPAALSKKYSLFAVQVPLSMTMQEAECDHCRVIGRRLDIRGRQNDEEIRQMLAGDVLQHLFVRELLIEAQGVNAKVVPEEGCR